MNARDSTIHQISDVTLPPLSDEDCFGPPLPLWQLRLHYNRVARAANAFHYDMAQAFYRSRDWRELSYVTKQLAGWRCQCCGKSAADGVKIVCDHIKPIRHFWELRLDPDNVQCLCEDCNLGKGSWDDTDFREVT
jgi:5-methylcytosine-specific restriction endonuclease McrA